MNKTIFARTLRINQTDAEKLLWYHLRKKQLRNIKFRRQQPIETYVVDFISFEKKLIIELDGGQHNEIQVIKNDVVRTNCLRKNGYKVLRFWNNDVLTNINGVLERIIEELV